MESCSRSSRSNRSISRALSSLLIIYRSVGPSNGFLVVFPKNKSKRFDSGWNLRGSVALLCFALAAHETEARPDIPEAHERKAGSNGVALPRPCWGETVTGLGHSANLLRRFPIDCATFGMLKWLLLLSRMRESRKKERDNEKMNMVLHFER